MPIARVRMPDGRVAKFNVPEGTTPDQVKQYAAANADKLTEPEPVTAPPPAPVAGGLTPPEGYDPQSLLDTMRRQPAVEDIKAAASNIPSSSVEFAKNIYQAIRHPIESGKGLASVAAGAIQTPIPGEQGNEQAFQQFIQGFADRYGSPEQFRETFIHDPVGTLADLSGLMFAGGGSLRMLGKATGAAGMGEAGRALSAAGTAADPLNIASRGVSRAVGALTPEGAPASMYESAAKFSTTIPDTDRARMAQLAVDEGIMPTSAGVDKTRGMIDNLNTEITRIIDTATETGQTIDTDNLFQYLDEVRKDAILTGTPVSNIKAIDNVEKQIKLINRKMGKGTLTPKEAQRLKQNIYKDVNYASTKEKVRFKEEAQKAVARAAKEELERIHPEIKALNASEGALIELLKSIERSASRIGNRDLLGIGTPMKGTLGGVVGGAEGALGGILAGILDAPTVKSKLAIALRKAQKKALDVPGAPTRAALYQTEKTQGDR